MLVLKVITVVLFEYQLNDFLHWTDLASTETQAGLSSWKPEEQQIRAIWAVPFDLNQHTPVSTKYKRSDGGGDESVTHDWWSLFKKKLFELWATNLTCTNRLA